MVATYKQDLFINFYIESGNGAQAARRAGYSAKSARITASLLLTNPNIQTEVLRRRRALAEDFALKREDIMAELLLAIEMARLQSNPAIMINGWREIAKMCGFYTHDSSVPKGQQGNITNFRYLLNFSDDELINLINK